MLGFISRVLIVMVVFTAGALVGNIYMPQRHLEQELVTSISEPATSLALTKDSGTQDALKALEHGDKALAATGMDAQALFTMTDSIRRTLVVQAYKTAKYRYELALIKAQSNTSQKDDFIKAQENYFKTKTLVETYYPLQKPEIEIIDSARPTQQATQAAQPPPANGAAAGANKTNK